jgi:type III pantothenate kinase
MILALDVGNSQIYGGVFIGDELKLQFRKTSKGGNSSDEFGLFLRSILRENNIDPDAVKYIAVCSVVPDVIHSLKGACVKYFNLQPFILQAGVKTGLKIKYRNPIEVGADRIANSVAASGMFPDKNLIIADFGTATTFCAVSADREYLGGLILPGFRISMEALESQTAKLPVVEIVRPTEIIGRSTVESIQSGLYFSNLHALRGISDQIKKEYFKDQDTLLIGTGGFSRLFDQAKVFDHLVPDLVLRGVKMTLELNA